MLSLLKSYKLVQRLGILHSISFTTVNEYLFLLRGVSRVMGTAKDAQDNALGRRGMYYLAAAVSDFFIPRQRMVSPSRWVSSLRQELTRGGAVGAQDPVRQGFTDH